LPPVPFLFPFLFRPPVSVGVLSAGVLRLVRLVAVVAFVVFVVVVVVVVAVVSSPSSFSSAEARRLAWALSCWSSRSR
jgi:hypothetical protein